MKKVLIAILAVADLICSLVIFHHYHLKKLMAESLATLQQNTFLKLNDEEIQLISQPGEWDCRQLLEAYNG
ncbi:MAG: hypothetical protein J6P70_01275, partial [Ruminobacter sp.]|nr:hypothetical protein [Ruminobacter sp.]